MIQPFDQLQKLGQEQFDAAIKVAGTLSRGAQTLAADSAELARKTFEHGSTAVEQLLGVRTLDKAMEIHVDFVRKSYDGLVSHSAKVGEFYSTLATEAFKPYEKLVSKAVSA
ncbi:phasin family protein [Microvirga thermotolerans]|uniref:Phasin family protein n=1 Tax=Microvirga thermotolerans TaxID=2651334 RepID=A0A5P9JZJ2_9HYPH|nr:phasin family protein [Microvirga thermotolerans]QFU16685.1 phasin family protein [Microvirga thermotolerans]